MTMLCHTSKCSQTRLYWDHTKLRSCAVLGSHFHCSQCQSAIHSHLHVSEAQCIKRSASCNRSRPDNGDACASGAGVGAAKAAHQHSKALSLTLGGRYLDIFADLLPTNAQYCMRTSLRTDLLQVTLHKGSTKPHKVHNQHPQAMAISGL